MSMLYVKSFENRGDKGLLAKADAMLVVVDLNAEELTCRAEVRNLVLLREPGLNFDRSFGSVFRVDMDATDNDGWTALGKAVYHSHEALVRLLVELRADKDATTNDGRAALHWAACKGHEAIIRLLVELGADNDAKANDGGWRFTALLRVVRKE